MAEKIIVIIPTYNEVDNIKKIVPAIFGHVPEASILVVDDSSPDGTGEAVEKMRKQFQSLNLLTRAQKQGLGRAYIAGFNWAIEKGFEIIIEMDADFSHRPEDLRKIVDAMMNKEKPVDFVIGSRYVPGGGTVNWGMMRKIISRGGGIYSRLILGFPINDWTGGFNAWKKEVLQKIGLDTVTSNGYSFQIELKYKASKNGFKNQEVPILFEDRRVGKSKMSLKIVLEAFYKVWSFRF